jgi:AI-2 transport protein TqsA
VIVFLLGFIPTFGSLISGALPVIYAFVQKDFATAMGAGIGVLVIEQIMGNFIDPRVQGRQLSLSTLVVLITLLIWTWIWGVAGAILAVPITIAAMIISAHVPRLRPFALFLSDATEFDALDRQARDTDR